MIISPTPLRALSAICVVAAICIAAPAAAQGEGESECSGPPATGTHYPCRLPGAVVHSPAAHAAQLQRLQQDARYQATRPKKKYLVGRMGDGIKRLFTPRRRSNQ